MHIVAETMTMRLQSAEQWKDDLIPMPNGYNLSSTPLNESIMAAMKMVPAFQKKYNIDKMNTVFLTDGASDGGERIVSVSDDDKDVESDAWSSRRYGHRCEIQKLHVKCKHFVD